MKKITLLLLTICFSLSGYSQLALEGFESSTGPTPLPSTTWTLGTGNWAVFNNGIGLGQRWGINSSVTTPPTPPIVYQGLNAAYVNRENIGQGNTSEDYLATPLVTIPTNGQLHFYTRSFTTGNQGTVYQIKIAPATASQTNPTAYTLVQQWTEVDLTTTYNIYEEKVVSLSAYAGQQVYISFVKVFTQPLTTLDGDRWLVDNVSVVEQCLDPTTLTASGITQTSVNLSWGNPSGASSWEIEVLTLAGTATGTGVVYNGALPYTATATATGTPFTPTTDYKYYVRALCTNGANSQWVGPFLFSTTSPGFTCAAPIVIGSVPYSTTDSTANYGDTTDVAQPAACAGTATNYMTGNDVFYSYTPTADGAIGITMTPGATWSGIFVYDGCANVGVSCIAGVANTGGGVRVIPSISVIAGHQYIIAISTNATPQTVGYTLVIQMINCAQPATLSVGGLTQTSVNLSWANPGGATSWEVAVQPVGSPIPTGAGTQTNINTNFPVTGLTVNTAYQYYVRADCNNGTFSPWAGPFLFSTLCNAFTVPFQEGFNTGSTTENCWTVLNSNGDNDLWNMNYVTAPFEGNQCVDINTDFNGGANDDWLISPQIILNGNQRLKFHYRVQSVNEPNDFRVMLSTNGASPVDFTNTIIPLTSYSNVTYIQRVVSLVGYTGPVNIGWHVPAGGLDGWRILIDNVIIEDLPSCAEPTLLTTSNILTNSATIAWTNGNTESAWQVLALPCGSPAPTAAATGFIDVNTNPYTLTGLTAITCYDVYVRAVCSTTDSSPWTGPATFTSQVEPPVCDGIFTDSGGTTANYANNTDSTVTVCPINAGDQVMVTFTVFNVETNWDALYVFDGDSVLASQISSTNGAGNVPGGLAGGYWGSTIPGPFTSSSVDGCLTFRFRSNGTVNTFGWVANVTCNPPPTCPKPTAIIASGVTQNSATISWTEVGSATSWQVLIVPNNAPVPDASTTGWVTANTNPFEYTGLNSGTLYKVYLRAYCSDTDISQWSNPTTFATLITNDECLNAINVPINPDVSCAQIVSGMIIGATASTEPNGCNGTSDDDVWFSFVATTTTHNINLNNITGSTTDLFHVVYSGSCSNLTQVYCSDANSSIANSLVVGQTYYIRIYSFTATPGQTSTFNVCIGTIPPPIATNNTQHTIVQLVEDVFLNSTCATVSNVTSSTGTNFGSTNGIGYFNQNGSGFPFSEGIVLTSGDAMSAPGPNTTTLSDGITAWVGDTQLEAIILAATGNAMNSRNATKLEFDFVPLVSTINFNFIFASEEYGTFQCAYSDAFAFLLTDISTGITTNLAVIPNTTSPVSVVTIRDQLYNNGCTSVNPEYFDTFYGAAGLDPLGSPTNFNGNTVPLTATATVTPGNQYHIKLVIADRLDNSFDSAVFLEGGSLDIGNLELGTDFLQVNNTALCTGTNYTIETGLSPSIYSFSWTIGGNPITNETGPSLTINQQGIYSVTAQFIGTTCSSTDSITIEYYEPFNPGTPNTLTACDNSDFAQFDLSQNNAAALGSLDSNGHNVTYYTTNTDAIAETNMIPLLYTNITNPQTLYVRVENSVTGCFETSSFNLVVNPAIIPLFTIDTNICQSEAAPILPNLSNNNFTGTWSPALVDNLQTGNHTFTPDDPSCLSTVTITVTVNPIVIPTFLSPAPICSGDTAPVLPLTSLNEITGTWSPAVVDNTQTATYTFTPNTDQCATTTTMVITVYQDCSFGSYASAVWLTNCETGDFFNTVGSGTSIIGPAQNIFPNTDFGTYSSYSNTFKLRGAEVKTFKIATANVCSARLHYRIYPASGTPGAFAVMDLPFFNDCISGSFPSGGPCNPGDQKWQKVLTDAELPIDLTAYPAGEYVIEVYYDVTGDANSTTQCDDTILINNNGANFIATYTLQSDPTFTSINPTACVANDGSITIGSLAPNTTYSLTYSDDSSPVGPITISTDNNGLYTLNGLNNGSYSNFNLTVNSCAINATDVITLNAIETGQIAGTNPSTCGGTTGTITISNLDSNQTYAVSYTDDTVQVGPTNMTSDANGLIVLTGLNAGVYGSFTLTTTNCTITAQTTTLVDPGAPIVTVNSAEICSGQSTTITATPQVPGSYNYIWTVPSGFTNPGNVASFSTSVPGTYTVVVTPLFTTFCNGSFESPTATGQFPNMLNENLVPCWDTTAADGILEVWPAAGFENVFAYQGTQFIEMNGNSIATVFQDFTTSPGAELQISFAHRGRQGNDTVRVEIGPVGGPYVSLGNFTDGNTAWILRNLTYTVPTTGGNNYTLRFVSVSSAGGSASVGNFLDAVNVTSSGCNSSPASGTVTLSPSVSLNLTTANNTQTVCINTAIATIAYTSTNATTVTVTGLPSGVNGLFDSNTGVFTINGTAIQTGTFNYTATSTVNCNTVTLTGTITVNPTITSTFTPITICSGQTIAFPASSLEGLTGTWNQATIDNTQTGTYTFTPNSGQCALQGTLTITVNPLTVPTFNPVLPICSGDPLNPLPTNSIEGIVGTWSPALNNTATTTYTFTPNGVNPSPSNLVVNGNFTAGNSGFSTDYQYLIDAGLNGVQKAYGIVTAANTWFQFFPACTSSAPSGGNMMVVDGSTTNGGNDIVWSQTVTVQPNQTYNFSYWLQTVSMPNPAIVEVTINGVSIGMTTAPGNNCEAGQYSYTWNSGSNTTAQIAIYDRDVQSNGNDFSLDDISLIQATFIPCPTTTTLTITVNQPVTATFNTIAALCSGGTAPSLPATSLEGFTGTWTPAVIDNITSGSYTFVPDAGQCAVNGNLAVIVQSSFDFEITGSCVDNDFILEVTAVNNTFDVGTASYNWFNSDQQLVGTNSNTFNVTDYLSSTQATEELPITFSVRVTTPDGCFRDEQITLDRIFCGIQKGISANNDGNNDYFDLTQLNVRNLTIFNRYGMKVYSKTQYRDEWKGQSDKGDELPDGTYFYVIEFDNEAEAKTGWIYKITQN